jgi:hypothetical protein
MPVASSTSSGSRPDVVCARRLYLTTLLSRQPHRQAVARRVWLDASVVEDHGQDADGLADRLLPKACFVQVGDERGDHLGVHAIDRLIAESREDPSQGHAIGRERSRRDVDAGRLPARRAASEGGSGCVAGEPQIRHTQRG